MLYGLKENSMLTNRLAASTHLSSKVSQLFEPQLQKKSPFSRTTAHIFVSPEDAPATITQYVAWMEFGAYKLSRCMCPSITITVSEIQRDICEKIVILSYPLTFDAPVRGSRRNIGTPFGRKN